MAQYTLIESHSIVVNMKMYMSFRLTSFLTGLETETGGEEEEEEEEGGGLVVSCRDSWIARRRRRGGGGGRRGGKKNEIMKIRK